MQGYSFKVDYIKKRSRIRSLFAPIIVLPLLLMLLLWSSPSLISNLETDFNLFNNTDSITYIDNSTDLKNILSDEIQANQRALAQEDESLLTTAFLHHAIFNIKQYVSSVLQNNLAKPLVLIFYCLFILFCLWSLLVIMLFNISSVFIVFFPVMALLSCCNKYPSWIFSWNRAITSFVVSTLCYLLLLSPHFPDLEASDKTLVIPHPGTHLGRFMPLFKWFLVLPHSIILLLLMAIFLPISFIGYLITIITGQYPGIIFKFVEGYLRWNYRVICYAQLLCSDQYPQFSFSSRYDDNT